jgi:hypothetical protein
MDAHYIVLTDAMEKYTKWFDVQLNLEIGDQNSAHKLIKDS